MEHRWVHDFGLITVYMTRISIRLKRGIIAVGSKTLGPPLCDGRVHCATAAPTSRTRRTTPHHNATTLSHGGLDYTHAASTQHAARSNRSAPPVKPPISILLRYEILTRINRLAYIRSCVRPSGCSMLYAHTHGCTHVGTLSYDSITNTR